MIARTPRRVVLDDGTEIFAHPIAPEIPVLAHGWDRSFARCRRYRISRARIGGHACGVVTRLHKDDWSAIDPDGAAVWDEQTGKNWPTLRVACEKLAAAVEEDPDNAAAEVCDG